MKRVSNRWLGFLLYFIIAVMISQLVMFIMRNLKKIDPDELPKALGIQGSVVLIAAFAVRILGIINAKVIKVNEYDISISKTIDDTDIVLLADLYLGFNTEPGYIEKLAQKVNGLDADLIVIAGDIFDNEYDAMKLLWENSCGYVKIGDMHSVVTSGAGEWGPDIRVGTDSEIAVLRISN